MEMIEPRPHTLFGKDKGVRSVIQHIVFFTEWARKRKGKAMKKTTPQSFLFMGQTNHRQSNSLRREMKKLP